ncbi:MAG: hypothetical protein Q8O92_02445 [Candidatus Latescibacter sp.]|nr:hypothetical protein [Candidatus Latescibacter sp.]
MKIILDKPLLALYFMHVGEFPHQPEKKTPGAAASANEERRLEKELEAKKRRDRLRIRNIVTEEK